MVTADESTNDRLFCWEQVARTNNAFRISQVFAGRKFAARLLPLYAWFSIIEQICGHSSDEDLAKSKLNWWRLECSPEKLSASHHPVLRELKRTGALDLLAPGLVGNLLNSAEMRLEESSPSDISELLKICIECQKPQYDLELAACDVSGDPLETRSESLAPGGLIQLLRESVNRDGQGAYWWVPLNLLARYGINRDQLVSDRESNQVAALWTDLLSSSEFQVDSVVLRDWKGGDIAPLRNFFAIQGVYSHKLKKLKSSAPERHGAELERIRISDLVIAWRSARRTRI